jgi:primary-amine oxidase
MHSGNPEHPHQRKHAFDLGEYGAGYMTNSLTLGCDCKGAIHYLDAEFPARDGSIKKIKNAICIHEEDAGILFKHNDFRDDSSIVTRARKLIVQQVFTAANYEYAIQVCSSVRSATSSSLCWQLLIHPSTVDFPCKSTDGPQMRLVQH